jgi:mannosyltransferase OCH1-like enzyme
MTKVVICILSILLFLAIVYIILFHLHYFLFLSHDYYKLIPCEKIKINDEDEYFPKILVQTISDKSKIPEKVFENIKKYASDFKHVIFDDEDCINFIKEHYPEEVLEAFNRLSIGAHKADLFRYCYLYINGGLYADIKTEFVKPVSSVFHTNKLTVVMGSEYIHFNTIYNGIIYSKPRHPIFLELISHIVHVSKQSNFNYLVFCNHFYKIINRYHDGDYYKLYEKCSSSDSSKCHDGFDRYKLCCNIYDGDEIVIKGRYSDYPW